MADKVDKDRVEGLEKEETAFNSAFKDAMNNVPGQAEPNAPENKSGTEDDSETQDDNLSDDGNGENGGQEDDDPNAQIVKQFSDDSNDSNNDLDDTDYQSLYEQEKAVHEKEKQRNKSWEGRISAANKRADAAEEKASNLEDALKEAKESASFFKLNLKEGEAQSLLDSLEEDAPDLKKAIIHIAGAVAKEIALEAINQYMPNMEPLDEVRRDVQAVKAEVEIDSQAKHLAAIDQAHPDREEIIRSGVLKKWILRQPSYRQPALKNAYNKGNTQDVIDLIKDFKDATGWKTKTENIPANTHQKSDKDRKLESQIAVRGEHAPLDTGNSETDTEDFSSAFEEAASRKK